MCRESVAGDDMTGRQQIKSRSEEELAHSIEEVITDLAATTAADAEAAGVAAGEPAEEVPGKPDVGKDLGRDLSRELVVMALLASTGWALSRIGVLMPRVIAWWLARRAQRQPDLPPDDEFLAPEGPTETVRAAFHLERRLVIAMAQTADRDRISETTLDELHVLKRRFRELRRADPPEYLVRMLDASVAHVEESLAEAHAALGNQAQARTHYAGAEAAWGEIGEQGAAERCRSMQRGL
jgi:hypothetical protein